MEAASTRMMIGLHSIGLRCADLVNGGTDQLKAHDQNCNRDKKPGDVFHSSMSEGVLGVRFLSGELKAYKGNHRRAGV